MQSAECRVQSAECRVQSAECRVQSAECRVQSAECRVQMFCRISTVHHLLMLGMMGISLFYCFNYNVSEPSPRQYPYPLPQGSGHFNPLPQESEQVQKHVFMIITTSLLLVLFKNKSCVITSNSTYFNNETQFTDIPI